MLRETPPLRSDQVDIAILSLHNRLLRIFLGTVVLVAAPVLLAWLWPAFASLLPERWHMMKANTSLLTLTMAVSLLLTQSLHSRRKLFAGRVLAWCVVLFTLAIIFQYATGVYPLLDNMLAYDPSEVHGNLSAQITGSFLLLGLVAANFSTRHKFWGPVVDALLLASTVLILMVLMGYVFQLLGLPGPSIAAQMSPQTLFCVGLLNLSSFFCRAEYGIFRVLMGTGIGGRIARLGAPWGVMLPLLMLGFSTFTLRSGLLPQLLLLQLSAALIAILVFCLVIALAYKSNQLEIALSELSLRDELTKLYNRRGFFFLAEQALGLAQRTGESFSVLFIDVDNLKQINDTYGHDPGSDLLQQLARILEATFRKTDIIGRIGGDEFVIATRANHANMVLAMDRLDAAVAEVNRDPSRPFPVSFSAGFATLGEGEVVTLSDLIDRADSNMYEAKRLKKQATHPQ